MPIQTKAIASCKEDSNRQNLLTLAIEKDLSLSQIKDELKKLSQKTDTASLSNEPNSKIKTLSKLINQSKMWQKNPKKWKKIEGYLQKIESLLEQEETTLENLD